MGKCKNLILKQKEHLLVFVTLVVKWLHLYCLRLSWAEQSTDRDKDRHNREDYFADGRDNDPNIQPDVCSKSCHRLSHDVVDLFTAQNLAATVGWEGCGEKMPVTLTPTLVLIEVNIEAGNDDYCWCNDENCMEAHDEVGNDKPTSVGCTSADAHQSSEDKVECANLFEPIQSDCVDPIADVIGQCGQHNCDGSQKNVQICQRL